MSKALQSYVEKYIKTPDIDYKSDYNRERIFQEGGFSRYFPVLPGGYQPIQAPTGTPPELGQHALWNSVAQNLQGMARIQQGNRQLKMTEAQNKIDNELGYARLELAKQQLSQQDTQFKISSAFEQIRLTNTLRDDLMGLEMPAYRSDKYSQLIAGDKIPEAMQKMSDVNDTEGATAAAGKVNSFLSRPELIQWSMEKKRDDKLLKDIEALAKADPLSLQYKNYDEAIAAVTSGQQPPPIDWIGDTAMEKTQSENAYYYAKQKEQDLNTRAREATTALTEVKIGLAEIEAMGDKLEYEALKAAVDDEPNNQKKVDIINGYKQKKSDKVNFINPNNPYSAGWLLGKSDEERKALMLEFIKADNTNSMKVSNTMVTEAGTPLTNPLANHIIDASNKTVGEWGAIQTGDRKSLSLIAEGGNYTFRQDNRDGPAPTSMIGGAPGIKRGPEDSFYPTHTRVNPDGSTVSVNGTYITPDKATAEKLGYKGEKAADGNYHAPNVSLEVSKDDVGMGGVNTGGPQKTSKAPSATARGKIVTQQGDYYILTNEDGSKVKMTKETYDRQVAANKIPKVN